ncbi:MAG: DEAD/DEAH box helicase [Candidatus Micrarchaeia archaeon]
MLEQLEPYSKMLKREQIEARDYQVNIAESIYSGRNTLVVLPTGLGKTVIAVFSIAKAIYEGKKALMLAPTKPLSEQHYESLTKFLNVEEGSIALLTGSMQASEREVLERKAKVLAATPQTISNDLKAGRFSLEGFGVVVFDECHRAVGRYAYTYIADECKLRGVQLVGLTASPGSDKAKVNALIETLGVENIEIRVSDDPDVAPYVMGRQTTTVYINKGEGIDRILSTLKPLINLHMENLYKKGLSYSRSFEKLPKRALLEIGKNIAKIEAKNYKFAALFDYVYVLDLSHAYDLLSTEGIYPFLSYIQSLEEREEKSRAVRSLLASAELKKAVAMAKEMQENGEDHGKMFELVKIMKTYFEGKSTIIFAQYRSTIRKIAETLEKNGIKASVFVGKGEGVTQEKQKKIIEDFRNGVFNVLVATSIGEEGLDIPSVDAVIFYEPIPSEIRNIQRKGRTGRVRFGNIVILVAKDTKDEAYLLVSRVKEKRMKELIARIKDRIDSKRIERGHPGQTSLKANL